jgi:hypothetical protein
LIYVNVGIGKGPIVTRALLGRSLLPSLLPCPKTWAIKVRRKQIMDVGKK